MDVGRVGGWGGGGGEFRFHEVPILDGIPQGLGRMNDDPSPADTPSMGAGAGAVWQNTTSNTAECVLHTIPM